MSVKSMYQIIKRGHRAIFLLGFLLSTTLLWSTHNRAGEITYEQIGPLSIRITVTTYTKTSSTAADRDSLEIFWGDGTSQFVARSNGGGEPLPNDIKLNKYIAEHTYPGRATYTIYFVDPNRVSDILNVNPPNSIEIPFFLSTTFTFLDPQFQGFNNSATLLQPPLDFGCVGQPFIHNPNAYDRDGDSLSFELIVPLQDVDLEVPNYFYPDRIGQSSSNTISLDPVTGTFTWDSPTIPGEYNIAFRINEYREGILINSIIRDMQVLVRDCNNEPPTIDVLEEICVIAGETIELPIIINDPNERQLVEISATGGPFVVNSPAELIAPTGYSEVPFEATLRWETNCNHISNNYYQIVIRAVDNYFADSSGLATLQTVRIKVMGPPPEGLTGESVAGALNLKWDLPYACENAEDEYFQGFSIWRKEESTSLSGDTCQTGLEGLGYRKIVFVTNENDGQNYFYNDPNVEPNVVYCYRVLAEFALFTNTGNPFNRVESIPSEEICLIVKRDLPFLTEASVFNTDQASGVTRISWTKPVAADLDTILNPGPYRYQLQRQNGQNWQNIAQASYSSTFFNTTIDTSYLDMGLNTTDNQYTYRVGFYVNGNNTPYGFSKPASTIFLSTLPNDKEIRLSWSDLTPWNNYAYKVLRRTDSGSFDTLAITSETSYLDSELENGLEYCYLIRSEGSYRIPGIRSPLINNSQIVCDIPTDLQAPCPPFISVTNDCEENPADPVTGAVGNTISWFLDESCSDIRDISEFRVYYSFSGNDFSLIHVSEPFTINEFFHQPESGIAGCYLVTAVDTLDNESENSEIICVENCPNYILPNTFTPNQDGANDLFIPRVNRFISRIDLKVYNQWGNLVFETNDPQINWAGQNLSGNDLKEGVYYYICRVFETGIDGGDVEVEKLKGHINLIR